MIHAIHFQIGQFCSEEHQGAMDAHAGRGGSKNKVEMVQVSSDGNGRVVECLKKKFQEGFITAPRCRQVGFNSVNYTDLASAGWFYKKLPVKTLYTNIL